MRIVFHPKKKSDEKISSSSTFCFYSRQAKHADVKAACILLGIRRLKSETDIHDAKLSKLRWICSKIERQRKTMKVMVMKQSDSYHEIMRSTVAPPMLASGGHSAGQFLSSSCNEKVNVGSENVAPQLLAAGGPVAVKMFRCDQCNQVFNSGQALGGHKHAHYKGPPLCRSGSNQKLPTTV